MPMKGKSKSSRKSIKTMSMDSTASIASKTSALGPPILIHDISLSEMEALKRDREHELGRSSKHATGEVTFIQQKLEQAVEDKEREVPHSSSILSANKFCCQLRRTCIEHRHEIQQKDSEINNLREEKQRLTMALHVRFHSQDSTPTTCLLRQFESS